MRKKDGLVASLNESKQSILTTKIIFPPVLLSNDVILPLAVHTESKQGKAFTV